jgi:hypothetical protein
MRRPIRTFSRDDMTRRVHSSPRLRLPLGPCWELEEGPVDSATFLRALPSTFPEATDAYFEGCSIAADVLKIFENHADVGPYLPAPQTIWSTGTITRFRCRFTPALFEALAAASGHHAEIELFDHVFRKRGPSTLLTRAAAQTSTTWRRRAKPTRQLWPFPVSTVAVRWLIRTIVPTWVVR